MWAHRGTVPEVIRLVGLWLAHLSAGGGGRGVEGLLGEGSAGRVKDLDSRSLPGFGSALMAGESGGTAWRLIPLSLTLCLL